MLLAACSGGSGDDTASPTTTSRTRTSLATTTTSTTPPSTYRSTTFGVPFTADLPGGWTVAERDAAAAQLYEACTSCAHEGEEHGEITLGLDLQDVPVDDAARQMAATPRLQASAVEPWSAGTLTGVRFRGQRPGGLGELQFPGGYHTAADADPIDVYVVRSGDKTVTILVDPHEAKGDDADVFRAAVDKILSSLTFAA